ncbi:hypothetical protein ACMXYX_18155 (plasmid) [Neptuniibacter sp. QD72_48]|uniref:hypothetical protein n=1 Tax=Neptuniibacter sp. QD72_48 TaxID=3398214 RepID=UPI0039F5F794
MKNDAIFKEINEIKEHSIRLGQLHKEMSKDNYEAIDKIKEMKRGFSDLLAERNTKITEIKTEYADYEQDLSAQINLAQDSINETNRKLAELAEAITETDEQIKYLSNQIDDREPRTTDHALIRYMDRILGIDVEAIRREILQEALVAQILEGGDGKYRYNGFVAIVKDRVVCTVYKETEDYAA